MSSEPFHLTIVVPHKNRSLNILPKGGQVLTLFPNLVQSLNRAVDYLFREDETFTVKLLVVDAQDPLEAAPIANWLAQATPRMDLQVENLEGQQMLKAFNKGLLLNHALDKLRGKAGPIFICDTDMLIEPVLLLDIRRHILDGKAVAPICWSFDDKEHQTGHWRVTGSGMIAFDLRWAPDVRYIEKDQWGGEDWDFLRQLEAAGVVVVRAKGRIYHQWHPQRMGWKTN